MFCTHISPTANRGRILPPELKQGEVYVQIIGRGLAISSPVEVANMGATFTLMAQRKGWKVDFAHRALRTWR